jgi:glycosyltransferase involved in cell wall biosynthesis
MILGLQRIKNEQSWIYRSVTSFLPLCDQILVFDDHSEDETAFICKGIPGVTVYPSPFEGLNEVRDKNWLLDKAMELKPEWICFWDGDEILAPGQQEALREAMKGRNSCLSLKIVYLWNDERTQRTDGVYGDFHRESVFRPNGSRFIPHGSAAHFHCGNVPHGNRLTKRVLEIPLLHMGYMHREDRIRKWKFYSDNDPVNVHEGYDPRFPERKNYPHVVQGDVPEVPANIKLRHAGPLELRAL